MLGGFLSTGQPFFHFFLLIYGDRQLDLPVVLFVEAENVLVVAAVDRFIILVEVVPADLYFGYPLRPETLGPDLGPCVSDAILLVETGALIE